MQSEFIFKSSSRRLIVLFLGWGMDASPFRHLVRGGFDILAVWDYTGLDRPECRERDMARLASVCGGYDEVVVVAWSYGVRIASGFLELCSASIPVTLTLAVNGTPMHVDERYGIPPAIFDGTLQRLAQPTVRKFYRRMFSSSEAFAGFMECKPDRSAESLKCELEVFARLKPLDSAAVWNVALIDDADLIFPSAAQRAFWPSEKVVTFGSQGHFPDFQSILDRFTVDKSLVGRRFSAARETYRRGASVQRRVAESLWSRVVPLIEEKRDFGRIIEVGAGTGVLTELYEMALSGGGCRYSSLELWDLAELSCKLPSNATWRTCDAETCIRSVASESVGLLLSSSTLQWFHSPERFVAEAYRVLRKGGIAAFALYGEGTFSQLRELTGVSLRYPSLATLKAALPAEAIIEVGETESISMDFASPKELLRHLRETGVNGASEPSPALALRVARRYPGSPDGRYRLSYCPLCLIFRKPL